MHSSQAQLNHRRPIANHLLVHHLVAKGTEATNDLRAFRTCSSNPMHLTAQKEVVREPVFAGEAVEQTMSTSLLLRHRIHPPLRLHALSRFLLGRICLQNEKVALPHLNRSMKMPHMDVVEEGGGIIPGRQNVDRKDIGVIGPVAQPLRCRLERKRD